MGVKEYGVMRECMIVDFRNCVPNISIIFGIVFLKFITFAAKF